MGAKSFSIFWNLFYSNFGFLYGQLMLYFVGSWSVQNRNSKNKSRRRDGGTPEGYVACKCVLDIAPSGRLILRPEANMCGLKIAFRKIWSCKYWVAAPQILHIDRWRNTPGKNLTVFGFVEDVGFEVFVIKPSVFQIIVTFHEEAEIDGQTTELRLITSNNRLPNLPPSGPSRRQNPHFSVECT